MKERKLVEIEDGVFVFEPVGLVGVDSFDWSWRVKEKFDKVDKDKQDVLNSKQYNIMGKDKAKVLRSKIKTMDLRRWGYDG